MDTVYVLRLRGGYYYIGYSRNFQERIKAHWEGRGAVWTQLHPVEEVIGVYHGNEEVEQQVTLKYMAKYGVHRVRGGPWSQVDIQRLPRDLVRAYSFSCHYCGFYGHDSNECPSYPQNGYNSGEEEQSCQSPGSDSESYVDEFCVRCGRNNHSYDNCRASFTWNRQFIGNDDCCSRCGRNNHWSQDCVANFDRWGNRL